MRVPLLVLALVTPVLAGCVAPSADVEPAGTTGLEDAALDVPALDAAAVLATVKSFSETFPMRRGDNDAHNAARAYLHDNYVAWGYETHMDEFTAEVDLLSTPTNAGGSGRLVNVIGIKWGTVAPEEWIVVGAHYDVTDGAVNGAYDDGSGTIIVQKLAEAYANVQTARTIVFANFDGEEQGLEGSKHMVEAMANGDWIYGNGTVVGMIDFDMVGIMYPADSPLVADVVSSEMRAVIERKVAELGIPTDKVEYRPISGGNSDNGPFKAAEIPSVLFISAFDEVVVEGAALPSPIVKYPFWHQLDTYEGMVRMAGGEENLRAGFQNVVDIGSDLLYQMASGMGLTFQAPQ